MAKAHIRRNPPQCPDELEEFINLYNTLKSQPDVQSSLAQSVLSMAQTVAMAVGNTIPHQNLKPKQQKVLEILRSNGTLTALQIVNRLAEQSIFVSEPTIVRWCQANKPLGKYVKPIKGVGIILR